MNNKVYLVEILLNNEYYKLFDIVYSSKKLAEAAIKEWEDKYKTNKWKEDMPIPFDDFYKIYQKLKGECIIDEIYFNIYNWTMDDYLESLNMYRTYETGDLKVNILEKNLQ